MNQICLTKTDLHENGQEDRTTTKLVKTYCFLKAHNKFNDGMFYSAIGEYENKKKYIMDFRCLLTNSTNGKILWIKIEDLVYFKHVTKHFPKWVKTIYLNN